MSVGERIQEMRKSKNLTQKELAIMSGTSEITIRQYEIGKREPRIEQLCRIAKVLNVSTDYLLGLSDTKSTDVLMKAVCDYTGLSENAIDSLRMYKNMKTVNSTIVRIPKIIDLFVIAFGRDSGFVPLRSLSRYIDFLITHNDEMIYSSEQTFTVVRDDFDEEIRIGEFADLLRNRTIDNFSDLIYIIADQFRNEKEIFPVGDGDQSSKMRNSSNQRKPSDDDSPDIKDDP